MSLVLNIKLLGAFSLTYGDRLIVSIRTARLRALLSYLILRCHTPQSRQRIAGALWETSTDTQARSSLRKEKAICVVTYQTPIAFS